MSTTRFGKKWADVDEDDEDIHDTPQKGQARFETPVDKDGIKTVIEYIERDNKTYKVSTRVKTKTVTHWTNKQIADRKNMPKFGKASAGPANDFQITKSEEEIHIEMSRNPATQVNTKDDAEDKFYEESLQTAESLSKVKKVWASMNHERQMERIREGGPAPAEEEKDKADEKGDAATTGPAPTKYLPPSIRNKTDPKGGGKGTDNHQQQEASLRITNLSEDVREGDLQDLFGQFGRLQRTYLAKDMTTGASRGFAFVTYFNREDAQKAIDKLNGHGYDNLILQVQFAKPKT